MMNEKSVGRLKILNICVPYRKKYPTYLENIIHKEVLVW